MCTVLLPPGDNPIAVNKYIVSYQKYVESTPGPCTWDISWEKCFFIGAIPLCYINIIVY